MEFKIEPPKMREAREKSWYLYCCYGDDFVGCPNTDHEDSVQYSEPSDRTQNEQATISEFSPER